MKKYWLTYLQPGEFGNDGLWAITYATFTEPAYPIAFYKTREAALEAYPEAIQL